MVRKASKAKLVQEVVADAVMLQLPAAGQMTHSSAAGFGVAGSC